MLRYIDSNKMGRGKFDWLDTHYHFSFAWYYNPDNMGFGNLRVINDDLVKPGTGFETHPHENMEIISYVVDGELTHADSMDNRRTLTRGQVQYMSAGTGVTHSEHNFGNDTLRFLQIWILPDKEGYEPNYGDYQFEWANRENKWMPIASGDKDSPAPIKIHSDMNVFATHLKKGHELNFKVAPGRQAYLVLIEGDAQIGEYALSQKDALEIIEQDIVVSTTVSAHAIIFEMKKEKF